MTTHATFARFTLSGVVHAIGTQDAVRDGVEHIACLADDAALSQEWIEQVARGSSIRLRVNDRPDLCVPLLTEDLTPLLTEAGDVLLTTFGPYDGLLLESTDGLAVTVETVTTVTEDDGSSAELVRTQTLTCTARERVPGAVILTLTDIEDRRLNTLFPMRTYSTADFPDLLDTDAGRAVPLVFGAVRKIPAVRVEAGATWRYAIVEKVVGDPDILTVYRGKSDSDLRIVDASEYSVGTETLPFAYRYIEFTAEQRDFDGSLFLLFADVRSQTSIAFPDDAKLVAPVLTTLFSAASITMANTFAANAAAEAAGLVVSCDFGRDGQRTLRAIIEDLLHLAGWTMVRDENGNYRMVFDAASTGTTDYNEDAGDAIEVQSVTEPSLPSSIALSYRPSPRDPGALQNTNTRAVTGGSLGAERPRAMRYIRDHEVADRAACYLAQRAAHSQRLRARIFRASHDIGDDLAITSRSLGLLGSVWRVRTARSIVGGVEVECERYSDALVTYEPGTLPDDAGNGYEPDYSATPPAAPTDLEIDSTATALQGDGTLVARVTADFLPPSANWSVLWMAVIHNTTSEITLAQAADVGGGRYGATLTGLRPGEVYQLKAWAVSGFGLQGVVQGTFDATAIGGGATDTTFTTAGYAVLPADVSSITATQGVARLFNVAWPAVTTANLREYVLERRVYAGSYAEVWRGQGRSYVDRDVYYGYDYTYRVKARDTYGNLSAAWSVSSNVTLTEGTVYGGNSGNDIGSSTVATGNRTAVSTVSIATGTSGSTTLFQNDTVAHGLGRVPLATVSGSTGVNSISSVGEMDSSDITVTTFSLSSESGDNSGAGDPHHHNLFDSTGLPLSFTVYVDIW